MRTHKINGRHRWRQSHIAHTLVYVHHVGIWDRAKLNVKRLSFYLFIVVVVTVDFILNCKFRVSRLCNNNKIFCFLSFFPCVFLSVLLFVLTLDLTLTMHVLSAIIYWPSFELSSYEQYFRNLLVQLHFLDSLLSLIREFY